MKPYLVHMVDGLVPCGISSFIPDLVAALPGWHHVVLTPGRLTSRFDPDTVGMVQLSGAEVLIGGYGPTRLSLTYGGWGGDLSYDYAGQRLRNCHTGREAHLPPAVSDVLFRMEAFHSADTSRILVSTVARPEDIPEGWIERYCSALPHGLDIASTLDLPYPHRSIRVSPVAFRRQMLESGTFVYVPRIQTIQYGRALYEALAMGLAIVAPRLPVFTQVFPEDCVAYFGTPEEAGELTARIQRDPILRNQLAWAARRIAVGKCLRNYMADVEETMEDGYGKTERPLLGPGAQDGTGRDANVPEIPGGGAYGAGRYVPDCGSGMAVGPEEAGR